jgi:hypothetical protein
MMQYAVFADLSCDLTAQERSAVSEALDSMVPNSGCVGRQKGPNDEVYFSIEAHTEQDARERAARYMNIVLRSAGLNAEYTLTLQAMERA